MSDPFHLVVMADVHYVPPDVEPYWPEKHQCHLGAELLCRAVADARRRGPVDAIALLGDLLNIHEGEDAPWASRARAELADTLADVAEGLPVLVVAGNHDGGGDWLAGTFASPPGVRDLGGIRFVMFADAYEPDGTCARPADQLGAATRAAEDAPGPVIALQHNPIWPDIDDAYPYMPVNVEAIRNDYARGGVLLSLSGHYHRGQAGAMHRGTRYVTAPCLVSAPHEYLAVVVAGRDVSIERRRLALADAPALIDTHAHTQFAYCRDDVTAEAVIERSRRFGLAGVCLTEHAGQLYCSRDEFWAGRHIFEPDLWRRAEAGRMAEYRRDVGALKSETVRVGLEVALDAAGELTLHDADRPWCDLLVGAIHWLPRDTAGWPAGKVETLFLDTCEALGALGADVLAHPWRVFRWQERVVPPRLHARLADILAATGTAAEINFHHNQPDVAFFATCVERGVKITFGTDAHALYEAGLLGAHLALLRHAAGTDDVSALLL